MTMRRIWLLPLGTNLFAALFGVAFRTEFFPLAFWALFLVVPTFIVLSALLIVFAIGYLADRQYQVGVALILASVLPYFVMAANLRLHG